ncbi:hypothetical protein SPBR_04498 [Sporothrix brasiliensis 5110]|uniref:Uncharacterized protein n=1 Tax=Sporothrix brasiliensis 5110 TaxID=1398154 RepID=A0A0C2F3X7_9PEZI|nr:uncharacterized protein SPBR_04498 [Sporothrix brasiliensis 5110]KIH93614.1 hypothetical protein SPBR_04498 [Sporothrix brasiliensis 5110]
MSTTTTATRTGRPTEGPSPNLLLSGVLSDYELHHSSDKDASDDAAQAAPASIRRHAATPADWDTEHRRVPAYRPINTARDQTEVRVYLSRVEQVFIGTMFTGVYLNSAASKVWRQTLGRVNGDIFRFRIGGEF